MSNGIKYWVSELSDHAQTLLVKHCKKQLKQMGYCDYEIERYVEDVVNEKLMNLEELVSRKLMLKYSAMS